MELTVLYPVPLPRESESDAIGSRAESNRIFGQGEQRNGTAPVPPAAAAGSAVGSRAPVQVSMRRLRPTSGKGYTHERHVRNRIIEILY